jgi:hypothetical protein
MSLSVYPRMTEGNPTWPALPLRANIDPRVVAVLADDILDAVGYRELLDSMTGHGSAAIAEFRAIRDRNGKVGGE